VATLTGAAIKGECELAHNHAHSLQWFTQRGGAKSRSYQTHVEQLAVPTSSGQQKYGGISKDEGNNSLTFSWQECVSSLSSPALKVLSGVFPPPGSGPHP
jgi:hypothetical protein